jgi:hypothetical protein
MNEIELLQQLRAGLPPARPEKRAAARARLIARIEHSGQEAAPLRTRARWRRPRLAFVAAGVALAALLVALPIGILGGSGKVQPAAAEVLRATAEVAAEQEPIAPGHGQFLYTRSKDAYLGSVPYNPDCPRGGTSERPCELTHDWSMLLPSEVETWVSFDDSLRGRIRRVLGKPRFVSADQRAGWVAAGSPPVSRPRRVEDSAVSGSDVLFDVEALTELPSDPVELREMIEAREIPGIGGPPGEAETFVLIGDMLRGTYLPSALRAAIYEVTAELPGVELRGEVEDPLGRAGIGIAFTDERRGIRHELIFDPTTSTLLGERDSLATRSRAYGFEAPLGTTIGYAAYLESTVVDSVGERPPTGAGRLDMSVGCYERPSLQGSAAILHDPDPIAVCAKLWREGVVGTVLRRLEREGKIEPRPGRFSPPLVACAYEDSSAAHVFPGSGPAVCRRLGLVPWQGW